MVIKKTYGLFHQRQTFLASK